MPYNIIPNFCPITGQAISDGGRPTGRFKEMTIKTSDGNLVKFGVHTDVKFDDIDKPELLLALKRCGTVSNDVESIEGIENELTASEIMFEVMDGCCMGCGRPIQEGQGWFYANGFLKHEMCKKNV